VNTADEPKDTRIERHASWAELFFDLVAVAGVVALAHVLESELDAAALGLYALLFLGFWLSWTTFMLYSNVADGQTRVVRLMIGMFGLGVMAASVPGVAHTVLGDGDSVRPLTVFAIAYMATRIYGSKSWQRGEVLLDFPVVQYSVGLLPWFVSIWVDEQWKLALWAVGIGLDLLLTLVLSGNEILEQVQTYFTTQRNIRRRPRPSAHPDRVGPVIHGVSVDPAHLSERLGLFVIIVLGESVVHIVDAASDAQYGVGLLATGIASFVLLAGMFGLSVVLDTQACRTCAPAASPPAQPLACTAWSPASSPQWPCRSHRWSSTAPIRCQTRVAGCCAARLRPTSPSAWSPASRATAPICRGRSHGSPQASRSRSCLACSPPTSVAEL